MDRALPTASTDALLARAALMKRVRAFFDARGFSEVDTPVLSEDSVVDRHLDPIPVIFPSDGRDLENGRRLWLQTSPEFAMKRLLCGGLKAIYQIAHAFRIGERGRQHNPEFTMLEWYRVGDDMNAGMQLLEEFANTFVQGTCQRVAFREVFKQALGIDPLTAKAEELLRVAQRHAIALPWQGDSDRELLVECLLSEVIQPNLGGESPVIVFDYPSWQAALAQTRWDADVEVAERFELYYRGVELANGYHELTDATELLRRNREVNALRQQDGKYAIPEESRLIEAMRLGMPKCSGVALGFDRLLMLLSETDEIDGVIPFPIERA